MAKRKSERIKIFIVLGLALVLGIIFYFRYVSGSANRKPTPVRSAASPVRIEVPPVQPDAQENVEPRQPVVHQYLYAAVRDIFEPLNTPPRAEAEETEQETAKRVQSLDLKGTIIGGKSPIAIINDRFLRTGDCIGEYRVVRIAKDKVILSSGNNQTILEVLKKRGQ